MFEKVDAYLIFSDLNRFYFTKFKSSFGCVILTKDRKFFITDFRYEKEARRNISDFEISCSSSGEFYKLISDTLKSVDASKVGYEDDYLTVSEFKKLKSELEGFSFKPISSEIIQLRTIKTEDEILKLSNAENVTQKALLNSIPKLKVGMTEKEFSNIITYEMLSLGAEGLAFDNIVCFGENSANPHHHPDDKKFEKNDIVLVDIGAQVDGYCGDMTRTFSPFTVQEQLQDIHAIVLGAQEYVLKNLKAGMTCHEADSLAREFITANGYGNDFGHALGHGVGVEVHEFPRVGSGAQDILQENMVVSVEPGIYVDGIGGVRIEDIVVIKNDGVINLTNFSKNINL